MFDDLSRLKSHPPLVSLLEHYVRLGEPDPAAWQPRLAELPDVTAKDISKLHGELIAVSLIEWNAASVNETSGGPRPKCYRATSAGRRALKLAMSQQVEEIEEIAA